MISFFPQEDHGNQKMTRYKELPYYDSLDSPFVKESAIITFLAKNIENIKNPDFVFRCKICKNYNSIDIKNTLTYILSDENFLEREVPRCLHCESIFLFQKFSTSISMWVSDEYREAYIHH